MECYSEDPCPAVHSIKSGGGLQTSAEVAHRVLLQTSPNEWRNFTFADVEFILRCGTQEDSDKFFAALHNISTQIPGATVLEAHQDLVRVAAWDGDFNPNMGAFWFAFDKPLAVIPHPGQKVVISGTYSSYSRAPFRINMSNSSFVHPRLPQEIKRR
jgi:hypothetical protein